MSHLTPSSPASSPVPPLGAHLLQATDKPSLRRQARARRDGMPGELRAQHTAAIVAAVLKLLPTLPPIYDALGRPHRGLGLYKSLGSEVDTHALIAALSRRCVPIALPRVMHDRSHTYLRFGLVDSRTPLCQSAWGVLEPSADHVAQGADLERLQVVLVPCLAFDGQGHRLGYGRGLYDRALSHFSGHTLGLAFAGQELPRLPHEDHDVALHGIVTEAGLTLPPGSPLRAGPHALS